MKITVPLARDVVMLALGCGGMSRELFLVPEPNMLRVGVCIGLLLGPAALQAWWLARNPMPAAPSTPEPPSLPASSSSSPGL